MGDTADDPDDAELMAYVRGTLLPGRAAEIAAKAAGRPELAAEIALLRGLAAVAAAEAHATAPGELGWARLSRALDTEARHPAAPARWPQLWPLVASAVLAVLKAQPASPDNPWGGPVLDMHFHARATLEQNIAHLDGCGVSHANLLTRSNAAE